MTNGEVNDHTHWHRERRITAGLSFPSSSNGGGQYAPIALEDHELDQTDESGALWARDVIIDDWIVVGGNAIGGSYVVWNCTVETLDVCQCRHSILNGAQLLMSLCTRSRVVPLN